VRRRPEQQRTGDPGNLIDVHAAQLLTGFVLSFPG